MGDTTKEKLPVTAAVLAGGRSMRMGVDKTLIPLDGVPLVRLVADTLAEVCDRVIVVTNRPDAIAQAGLAEGIEVVADDVAHQGPLGGLATALRCAGEGWVLAVAADMPWVRPEILHALWAARNGGQVVMPVGEKGPEPLLALYHTDVLPAALRALATGRRRLVSFFGDAKVVEVDIETLRIADPDLTSLLNVNTPMELEEAREADEKVRPSAHVRAVVEVGTRRPRALPVERPITVHLNDAEVATVQATPEDLEELGVGFMVAEGLLTDRDALRAVDVDHKRGMVYVSSAEEVPADLASRTRYVTSGCGGGVTFASLGHARGLERITSEVTVTPDELYSLMGQMARAAAAYRDSGGMHACGLGRGGDLVIVREDVGRHNALDKLLGRAWLDRVDTDGAVLCTTGRISYEMAVKAAKARVPVVCSRTAVTDLAAELADELGITLVGYARGGKMNIYAHAERIGASEVDE